MTRFRKHILLTALLAPIWCVVPVAHAESFADFLIRFVSHPSQQASDASSQLTINGKRVGTSGNYMTLRDTKNIAILCADSVDKPVGGKSNLTVNVLNFPARSGSGFTFAPSGRSFLLKEGHTLKETIDYEFLSFLTEYSHNHDFQMKRTIFPFPQRYYKNGQESDTKLLMPREWEYLDFGKQTPQICYFNNVGDANNRRLYIYTSGKVSKIYNFININHKWFLIEVENH